MGDKKLNKHVFLKLRTRDPEKVLAWTQYFSDCGPWSIGVGNILHERADAIVSPANSYGFMDGGIDKAYRNHFGLRIQRRTQDVIKESYGGKLPVGKAIIIPTGDKNLPKMIVAPTMERPSNISRTDNVYRAMQALLLKVLEYNSRTDTNPLHTIAIPSMGTGVGMMDYWESAAQMKKAVDDVEKSLPENLEEKITC